MPFDPHPVRAPEDLQFAYDGLAAQLDAQYQRLLADMRSQLAWEYESLLAAQAQAHLQAAQSRQRLLEAASARQHENHAELQEENFRLRLQRSQLQGEVDHMKERIARLKSRAKATPPSLEAPRRSRALEEAQAVAGLEAAEPTRSKAGGWLQTACGVAIGAASTMLALKGIEQAGSGSKTLAASPQQSTAQLEAGRESSPKRLLPSGR